MLERLCVKNVALIEFADMEFSRGLNILSGESGAGKSMLMDAVNFALGHRAKSGFARDGAEKAEVEAFISIGEARTVKAAREAGVSIGDDNAILISREAWPDGKTRCKINGKTATLALLREITDMLADVHGQRDHHSLLDVSRHIAVLDSLQGQNIESEKTALAGVIDAYKKNALRLRELGGSDERRREIIEALEYQKNEIESVNPRADEEQKLMERRKTLSEAEKIAEAACGALAFLDGASSSNYELLSGAAPDEQPSGMSAAEQVASAVRLLKGFEPFCAELTAISVRIDEVARDIYSFVSGIGNNPRELYEIETRLDAIYALKRKYGGSLDRVIKKLEETRSRLAVIEESENVVVELRREKKIMAADITARCEKISEMRKETAADTERGVESALREMGMKNARFKIAVERKKEFSASGFDRVEFMIAPNEGDAFMPLAKVASGGEISRVMLAVKAVASGHDAIETLIFDEIDTGVSGRAAQRVAEKLMSISRNHQTLCVTHSPQIAAAGERHFLVEKTTEENRVFTTIKRLDDDGVTAELARLISGARVTEASVKAAEEMRKLAIAQNADRAVTL
ncbi:MAG: DNA repair protein RecN [Clostridiales bacterium]|jgi:DNA repair protein RecN (Recombination protein N)|nr:DNA repair protein RecN [Clostridiales bacterium]